MPNTLIRVQYQQLYEVSTVFENYAQEVAKLQNSLYDPLSALQRGGYRSDGSAAFFISLEQDVFTGLDRLQNAMGEASRVMRSIETLFRTGEQSAGSEIPTMLGGSSVTSVVSDLLNRIGSGSNAISVSALLGYLGNVADVLKKDGLSNTLTIFGAISSVMSDVVSGKEDLGNAVGKAVTGIAIDSALDVATGGAYSIIVGVSSIGTLAASYLGKGGVFVEQQLYEQLNLSPDVRAVLSASDAHANQVFDNAHFSDMVDDVKNIIVDSTVRPIITNIERSWYDAANGDLGGALKNLAGAGLMVALPATTVVSNLFDPQIHQHTTADLQSLVIHGSSLIQLPGELEQVPIRIGIGIGDSLINRLPLSSATRDNLNQGIAWTLHNPEVNNNIAQQIQNTAIQTLQEGDRQLSGINQQIHDWLPFL